MATPTFTGHDDGLSDWGTPRGIDLSDLSASGATTHGLSKFLSFRHSETDHKELIDEGHAVVARVQRCLKWFQQQATAGQFFLRREDVATAVTPLLPRDIRKCYHSDVDVVANLRTLIFGSNDSLSTKVTLFESIFSAAAVVLCVTKVPRREKFAQLLDLCAISPRVVEPSALPTTPSKQHLRHNIMVQFQSDVPLAILSMLQAAEKLAVDVQQLVAASSSTQAAVPLGDIVHELTKQCKAQAPKEPAVAAAASCQTAADIVSHVFYGALEGEGERRRLSFMLSGVDAVDIPSFLEMDRVHVCTSKRKYPGTVLAVFPTTSSSTPAYAKHDALLEDLHSGSEQYFEVTFADGDTAVVPAARLKRRRGQRKPTDHLHIVPQPQQPQAAEERSDVQGKGLVEHKVEDDPAVPPAPQATPPTPSNTYSAGDDVKVQLEVGGRWYLGKVTTVEMHGGGPTYTIQFPDGDTAVHAQPEQIKPARRRHKRRKQRQYFWILQ